MDHINNGDCMQSNGDTMEMGRWESSIKIVLGFRLFLGCFTSQDEVRWLAGYGLEVRV